jgi:tetratricopeptide (TPR) repeat protein
VRIAFADRAPCTASTRISLIANTGFSLAETSVNGECLAEFFDLPPGKYRVTVTGDAVNADDGEIEIRPLPMQELEVRARRTGDSNSGLGSASFVSLNELGIPASAAKEFGKASRMIAKQSWSKATDDLHKALALYPAYAAAYNNLGAIYWRTGDLPQAKAALEQAIVLNDHLAPAYVNLARVHFKERDFQSAESRLNKAASLAILTADELNLLAYAQMMNQHPDQALETGRRAHASLVPHHAFLHLVAAHIYEQQTRIRDSINELKIYLGEEPAGPRSADVSKALAMLQTQSSPGTGSVELAQ